MGHHVVVGAGGIGRATATRLVELGHEVTLASRSGTDPHLPGVRAAVVDAADATALTALARGADSIVNAVNPQGYHQWPRDWPPVAAAMLAAAEGSGAGLVVVSNLYGYGRVDAPMTEETPLRPAGTKGRIRAQMWRDALATHEAGRIRATELRASDYFGPGAGDAVSVLNRFVIRPASRGKRVWLISGGPDVPHSWTYLPDIGALAAVLATDDRSWGRVWHVPTSAPRTAREVARDAAAAAGHPEPKVAAMPGPVKLVARVSPVVRELDETRHQFERPFVLDSTRTAETFGLEPTPWDQALAGTVSWVGSA
ncbi:MAG: NAD-dependent epimerase/dehydratase family protein [Nocardioidaceae bacterium]